MKQKDRPTSKRGTADVGFTTGILHSDRRKSIEHGSLHKPIHNSVAFGYDRAEDIAGVFQGTREGYAYGRQGNPTVAALEDKITFMERGVSSICFATGMAAISATMLTLLRSGDHLIASAYLFGNTDSLFKTFAQFGVEVSFVDATSVESVRPEVRANTRAVFVETIANPRTQVADLEGIGQLCRDAGLLYVVDNTLTTPYLFRPVAVGAHLVVHSLTKYVGGHGNVLGGSVTDTGLFDWTTYPRIHDQYKRGDVEQWGMMQIRKKGLRDSGATLAPDSAHLLAIGSETLGLRMDRACGNALAVAEFLESQASVDRVFYPGLGSHPEHRRAGRLFGAFGTVLSIDLADGVDAFGFLDALDLIVKSSNLGDNRTLAIPVAHTIFHEMGPERRASMGIRDGTVRFSVGIEDLDDLLGDLERALRNPA